MFDAEMTPTRMTVTKVVAGRAPASAWSPRVTFGILELKAESDYDKAIPGSTASDDIAKKGRTYALLTNVGIVLAAVGLVAAGIAGYPLVLGSSEKPKTTAFHLHARRRGPERLRGGVVHLAASSCWVSGSAVTCPACRCRSRASRRAA